MISFVLLQAATTCSTKMTVVMAGMTTNVKDNCPINMNCLNLPFETYLKDYSDLIPEEYQEQIGVLTEMLSIDKINMCNIWPADGCTTPETCTYFKQCSQTCSSKCLYDSGTFTRTIEPDMQIDDSVPTTFTLNGMLYCDYSVPPPGSTKLSTGAIVGIAIGVIVAVVILVAVVFFVFKRNSGKPNKDQKQIKNSNI
ncbi:Hypothetical_protein [Hexamita inflata]|uniref:Hypothetical_protein n=1 Tax=Hexamita inflata TaxID=28002 RepID=A0AA86R4G4_9EUKA|nr:Hypothetical protein HINF_LOCUS56845 [Hexamita inflata]CAI9969202.1 Hypothetical protein HINF_LOCUS56847 [Hexamita inflata]